MTSFQARTLIPRPAGTIKPQGRLRINWNEPLAKGLQFFACEQLGLLVNLVRPADVAKLSTTSTSYPVRHHHETGTGLMFDGASSLYFDAWHDIQFSGSKTYGAQYRVVADDTGQSFIHPLCRPANNNAGEPYINYELRIDAANALTRFGVFSGLADPNQIFSGDRIVDCATQYDEFAVRQDVGVVVADVGGVLLGYQKGILLGDSITSVDDTCASQDANANIVISGASDAQVINPLHGYVDYAFISNRQNPWKQEEILDFYRFPWQLVTVAPRILYFDSLTSTVKSAAPDPAEFGWEAKSVVGIENQITTPAEFGWEGGSPTLVQRQIVGVQGAEFGTETQSPPLAGFNVAVQTAEFEWSVGSPGIQTPIDFNKTPDHVRMGYEIQAVALITYRTGVTPTIRVFTVPITRRQVFIDPFD